jgi:hypothetical protein
MAAIHTLSSSTDPQLAQMRLPPHSLEAEQAVLGGLLLENGAWDRIGDVVSEQDFYRTTARATSTSATMFTTGSRMPMSAPNGQILAYRTTNRQGYREYASSPTQCAHCPMKGRCTQSANGVKVVIRHVWEEHKEAVDAHRLTETGKRLYKRRKETVERSFADAKELHGHRYARFRGLARSGPRPCWPGPART